VTPARQAVLVDFGLVRLATQLSPSAEGTFGYVAPEVRTLGRYSPASDRYAFGGLTYFMLTGQAAPDQLPAIRAGLLGVPLVATQPELVEHLLRMFDPDPEARPTCGEWIRLFKVSSTTSVSGRTATQPLDPGGLTPAGVLPPPTVRREVAPPVASPATTPPRRRSRKMLVGAIVAALVIIGAAAAVALSRGGGAGTAAETTTTAAAVTTTVPATSTTPVAPTTTAATTTFAPTTTVAPTTTGATTTTAAASTTTVRPTTTVITSASLGTTDLLAANTSFIVGRSGFEINDVDLNGRSFTHGIYADGDDKGSVYSIDFNLSRNYKVFTARVGLTDQSRAGRPVRFLITADGNPIYDNTMQLGQSDDIRLDVTNVLRLRIEVTGTYAACCDNGHVHGALGSPAVA
jgi:hypothetical protein